MTFDLETFDLETFDLETFDLRPSTVEYLMAILNPKPGSSSKRQHQVLVIAGRRQGFELAEIRKTVGGSITRLSAAECSSFIEHFSGQGLPNPPGKAPSPYGKKRSDAVRMITDFHVRRIARLGWEYFEGAPFFLPWLSKNFKVPIVEPVSASDVDDVIRQLGTAERAGQVIRVLREMLGRRKTKPISIAPVRKRQETPV